MKSTVKWIDKVFYSDFSRNWDDKILRNKILENLTQNSVVLDLGAGAGIVEEMNFRGIALRICGIDLDPRVLVNPLIDEGRVSSGGVLPYENNSFDVVFSDNVLEHLDYPNEVFCEVARVLKPDGKFLFKTPNRRHYMPTISRLTPHKFHKYICKQRGREDVDTFPTRYKANTPGDIKTLAKNSGLLIEEIKLIEGRPEYMRINSALYLLGFLYERFVNSSDLVGVFRILLVGTLRKPQ